VPKDAARREKRMAKVVAGDATRWEESRLWAELEKKKGKGKAKAPEAEAVCHTLQGVMPTIQQVLAQAGTSPTDFTLHDAGHGFRVAERMVELIGPKLLPKLSGYELGMLLLSAYLHDIGMTPQRGKVRGHLEHLLGAESSLSEDEIKTFTAWLDQFDVMVPLPGSEVRRAERLVMLFCRSQHNVWSAEWMRENLEGMGFGTYPGWVKDLIAVCGSHHYGYAELSGGRFDPRLVGEPSAVVNLRYLAAVLRMADILEFSPQRTPDVIFEHRDVSEPSAIFWHKDKHISRDVASNRIVIHARPTSAAIHRAIEVTVEQIEEEARLCRRLQDEGKFANLPGKKPLPHEWWLEAAVFSDVRPQDDTYEYIDGSFRPDTAKLLQLLSGTQLYGSELHAVRELLQNAFDAVREQIAWERLVAINTDAERAKAIADTQFVRLKLESREDADYLICTDTGVGMSKAIVRDYLLVSGASSRPELIALDRRCREHGFALDRTGEFGLGVLSYFMLADRVTIRTRRSQHADGHEPNGWSFETRGVGSFGELRRDSSLPRGTQIVLRLRRRLTVQELGDYLAKILAFLPCRLELQVGSAESKSLPPGWQRSSNALLHLKGDGDSERLLPYFKWHVVSGELSNGLGDYRIHLPYFEREGEASLGLLKEMIEEPLRAYYQVYVAPPGVVNSWHGMQVGGFVDEHSSDALGLIELDWRSKSAGRVAVNRTSLEMTPAGLAVQAQLQEVRRALVTEFVRKTRSSRFSSLSSAIARSETDQAQRMYWQVPSEDIVAWREVSPPVIHLERFNLVAVDVNVSFKWRNRIACRPPQLMTPLVRRSLGLVLPVPSHLACLEVVGIRGYLPVWDHLNGSYATTNPPLIPFPPGWDHVSSAETSWGIVLNANNPIVQLIDQETWLRARELQEAGAFPKEGLSHGLAALLLLDFDPRRLDPSREIHPERLWRMVLRDRAKLDDGSWTPIYACSGSERARVSVTLPSRTDWVTSIDEVRRLLPSPPPDWTMEVEMPSGQEEVISSRIKAGEFDPK
jgi:hypothetical protein